MGKYSIFNGKIPGNTSQSCSLFFNNKVVLMETKLSSGKSLSQSQSKMVKNLTLDPEITELLPFELLIFQCDYIHC
jgi:hypothetical protein